MQTGKKKCIKITASWSENATTVQHHHGCFQNGLCGGCMHTHTHTYCESLSKLKQTVVCSTSFTPCSKVHCDEGSEPSPPCSCLIPLASGLNDFDTGTYIYIYMRMYKWKERACVGVSSASISPWACGWGRSSLHVTSKPIMFLPPSKCSFSQGVTNASPSYPHSSHLMYAHLMRLVYMSSAERLKDI